MNKLPSETEMRQMYYIIVSGGRSVAKLRAILDHCGKDSLEQPEADGYLVRISPSVARSLQSRYTWIEQVKPYHVVMVTVAE